MNQNQIKRNWLGIACATGISVALLPTAQAASFTWDASGTSPATPTAGSGTWSTSNANWSDTATDSAWVNVTSSGSTPSNDAVIGGSSALTLGSAVTVRNITNTGTTTISGGTLTLDSLNATGTGSGNSGPILIGGSSLTISSTIAGTKGLAVNGGTVTLSGSNTYSGNTLISNGTLKLGANNSLPTTTPIFIFGAGRTFDLNGFNQTATNLSGSNGIVKNGSGTASTFTLNMTSNSSTGIALQNNLSLVKQGTGALTLSASQGPLNYTGSTTVSGGTLKLNNSSAGLTQTSSITINGGILVSGTAAGNLALGLGNVSMSSGSITPGEAGGAASFTLAANKNFSTTGGTINFELGTSYDSIIGSGTGTFSLTNTTLALDVTTLAGFSYGSNYNVFSGFASGSTSTLSITGYDTANYIASLSNGGVLSFTAVPEPSTYAMLGTGLAALAFLRRRRKNQA